MTETPDLPKTALVLIALVQGLLLLLLHESMLGDRWLAQETAWQYALFTAVIAGPVFLLLSLDTHNARRLLRCAVPFTLLIAALGYYVGAQHLPGGSAMSEGIYFVYALTMGVACFKALMYMQQYATDTPATYEQLYRFSWRNFLTQAFALAFMNLFWGILMLGAALFKVIGIDFFFDVFTDKWFLYPALGMAHGFGIIIFRSQQKIFDLAISINQALMKFLLVMLVLLAIGFLAALPFTGLAPLWETGSGSALILWLQALVLFFLNGVYQEGGARPYPLTVHRFIYVGVALLPIYSAIACFGLYLRIAQYGWSLERCWAVVIWLLFALFSTGYLVGICRLRDRWVSGLGWVNVRMGLLVLAILLMTNSPLLDFRKIVVASHMARLDSGAVTLEEFDYRYFRRNLGKPGQDALEALKQQVAGSNPAIAEKIEHLYQPGGEYAQPDFEEREIPGPLLWPHDAEVTPALLEEIEHWLRGVVVKGDISPASVFAIDLDADGSPEYLVSRMNGNTRSAILFVSSTNGWKRVRVAIDGSASDADLEVSMERGEVRVVAPKLNDLQVGGLRFEVYPE